MAVYVDQSKWNLGRMKMCHMIADTSEELEKIAKDIGLNINHIQYKNTPKEHFDICKSKREIAISLGAIEVSSKDLIIIIRRKRTQWNLNV